MAGVSADVAPQIGYLLSETMGGSLDKLRHLTQELGIDTQALADQYVQAGLKGDLSWHQVEVALQGVAKLNHEGLEAVGDYVQALDNLKASAGIGAEAVGSLRDLAIEAIEAGAKNLEELEARLRESGQFTEGEISAIFQALSQRGITSLEQLSGASDRELGGVVADIESISPAFFAAAKDIGKAAETVLELADNWAQVPETAQTEYRINVKVTGDQLPDVAGNAKGNFLSGLSRMQKFAKGGLLGTATIMGMKNGIAQIAGEAGPEFVMPAVRDKQGNLGVAASGSGGINIHVDARGAMPGVEMLIKQGVREALDAYNRSPGRY